MYAMPFQILGIWFRAILALALIGLGVYLLKEWYQHRETLEPVRVVQIDPHPPADLNLARDEAGTPPPRVATETVEYRRVPWHFGWNWPTAALLGGLGLVGWSFGGGWAIPRMLRRRDGHAPAELADVQSHTVRRPDGTEIHVFTCGPREGPAIIFTHGWSLNANEWYYARNELSQSYQLVFWDLPGLGNTQPRGDHDFGLDKMAQDLNLVIESVQCRPVILLGHSIGGMILLTYCRLFPHKLGTDVQGLVVAQSTYTNPVKTTKWAGLMTALQKPLLEPLCHLMILLSPVFWIMNWLAYFNGSAHRSTERSSFSGRETRQQLDFLTWEFCKAKPAHAARGFLAMFRYDATDVMPVVPIPSLVVAGDNDQTCLPTASALMAQIIPGAKLVTLPNSQHCGLFEHHQTFHAAVKEFVDALVPDRHRVTRISVPVGNLERPAQYKAGSA